VPVVAVLTAAVFTAAALSVAVLIVAELTAAVLTAAFGFEPDIIFLDSRDLWAMHSRVSGKPFFKAVFERSLHRTRP
jgi:hypothetical protein